MSAAMWQGMPAAWVDQAIGQIFQMLVETDAVPVTQPLLPSGDDVSLAVYCDDLQQSAVIARCSRALALSLTSRMLETPPECISAVDMDDAAGEIVNVIAGSLRGLIDSPGAMSTPFPVTAAELNTLAFFDRRTYRIDDQPFTLYRV